jgi:hypothetical protein
VLFYLISIAQPWFSAGLYAEGDYRQAIMFYASSVLYVITGAALAHDYAGFRQPCWSHNRGLVVAIVLLYAGNITLICWYNQWFGVTFSVVPLPTVEKASLILYTVIMTVTFVVLEWALLKHATPINKL